LLQGREVLVYLKSSAPQRDSKLSALIAEARASVTTYSYEDEAALEDQIRSDITSLVSRSYIDRFSSRGDRLIDPSAVLAGIMPAGTSAIGRPQLEQSLDEAMQRQPAAWVVGPAGSGKTVLLAQWAIRRRASYINARGLSQRQLVRSMVAALSVRKVAADVSASLEGAIEELRSAWTLNPRWPLVIDDPADPTALAALLNDLDGANANARVIIAARTGSEPTSASTVSIPSLKQEEIAEIIRQLPAEIRESISTTTADADEVLPLDIRRTVAGSVTPQHLIFDDVAAGTPAPQTRELLALIVASPEPLTLEDLRQLSSSEDENPVVIDGRLTSISYLVVDDGLGFRPVHETIAADLRASLARRPALHKFVSLRLAQFLLRTKRYMAAFELYRQFDKDKALRAAYRASSQAAVEGRPAHTIPPLEFIADTKRRRGSGWIWPSAFFLLCRPMKASVTQSQ
jgi:hypothetical protein